MATQYIITLREHPVLFNEVTAGRKRFELVDIAQASPFDSATEAWIACLEHEMELNLCAVKPVCLSKKLSEVNQMEVPL